MTLIKLLSKVAGKKGSHVCYRFACHRSNDSGKNVVIKKMLKIYQYWEITYSWRLGSVMLSQLAFLRKCYLDFLYGKIPVQDNEDSTPILAWGRVKV